MNSYPDFLKFTQCTEIAKRYIEWICLFGAAKQILSDQGKEFLNEVIKKLNNLVGTEHRVTSSYMPSTNGRTEKFNFTFVNTLRNFTEDDQITWIELIPFILLAYRSRIHSITKKSPYELVFGRKMNLFEEWKNEIDEDEEKALFKRTIEIKKINEL